MAKLTLGPVVSDARGSVAGVTFSRWKQTSYARRKTRPANPQTVDQVAARNVFRTLNNLWKFFGVSAQGSWVNQAAGRNYTGRNHFIGINMPILIGQSNLNDMLISPGMAGTVPLTSFTVTPGNDQLTLAATLAAPPTGFTLDEVLFAVLLDGDPEGPRS